MTVESGKENFRLGFLTAIEVPERGFVGGLLVTNHFGRPLEFQCTAPLKPNRAQEILYGPTLIPYVLGDLIGRTLIEKVGVKPHLVLTERNDLLPLRDLISIPVACVDEPVRPAEASRRPTSPRKTQPRRIPNRQRPARRRYFAWAGKSCGSTQPTRTTRPSPSVAPPPFRKTPTCASRLNAFAKLSTKLPNPEPDGDRDGPLIRRPPPIGRRSR